jgi:hypothetical protein
MLKKCGNLSVIIGDMCNNKRALRFNMFLTVHEEARR